MERIEGGERNRPGHSASIPAKSGFGLEPADSFQLIEGRIAARWPIQAIGIKSSVNQLQNLFNALRFSRPGFRLVVMRPIIRQFLARRPVYLLLEILGGSYSSALTCLAIWLAGRCESRRLRGFLVRFTTSENRRIRKEAVRALRRKQDWATLRRMAKTEPDPHIRRMSAGRPRRPFEENLAWFLRGKAPVSPVHLRRSVVLTSDYQPGSGLRPKPVSLIRRLLARIARLARGAG